MPADNVLMESAQTIKASVEAIRALGDLIEDSARSVVVEVNNLTSRTLTLQQSRPANAFRTPLPPQSIAPFKTELFPARSPAGGILVGVTARVVYSIGDDATTLQLNWDVPFAGGNTSSFSIVGRDAALYVAREIIGGGNTKVPLRLIIAENISFSPVISDWRTCGQCKSLVHAIDDGACAGAFLLDVESAPPAEVSKPSGEPLIDRDVVGVRRMPDFLVVGDTDSQPTESPTAGDDPRFGKHQATGDRFRLNFGVPGPGREAGWRKCSHCKALFFNGWTSKGVCPGRPAGHEADAAGNDFQLAVNRSAQPSQQRDWRFCEKCFILFFEPHNIDGHCAAGERHHAHAYNYVLDRD